MDTSTTEATATMRKRQRGDGTDFTAQPGQRFEHEWGGRDDVLINRIVESVEAQIGERSVAEAGPLYDVINPDALQSLFRPTQEGATRDVGSVTFQWAGHDVTVTATGETTVTAVRNRDE